MQIFYARVINSSNCKLDRNESRHCIKVLRLKKNSPVKIVDGAGNLYEGTILIPDPEECTIGIDNVIRDFGKRSYQLHIAISPLKNSERFEWFVEKSVEIGIDEITPIICKNTEKQNIKYERINNIIISAMKQSIKAKLTKLNEPIPFDKFIKKDLSGDKLIAHCSESPARSKLSKVYSRGKDIVILIGPEGDFSPEEVMLARKAGFKSVHLGSSKLRTETAGIAACHSVYFINQ
jgi:16S rRNA (uracil1498-N3)-methyltransferase